MTSFIRCVSCKFCLGPYVEFFEAAKAAYLEEHVFAKNSTYEEYDKDKLMFISDSVPEFGPILDALNIHNICCRMRLLTGINFDKIYK